MRIGAWAIALSLLSGWPAREALAWGDKGHEMTARVAARKLPSDMPAFFRRPELELGYLCPEPDRWRNEEREPALKGRADRDHTFRLKDVAWETVDVQVTSSLSAAFSATGHAKASQLAALAGRLVMWELDLRNEIDRGDRLRLVFREEGGELVVGAARYHSRRRAATFDAYRFKASADAFASYWNREGVEVPRRLKDGPLRSYDQITALLRDRPTHKGMDWKTPVGTPVFASRPGRVTRVNWRRGGNGRCLEIRFADGIVAKYLHLSEVKARPGQAVKRGDLVALTGNTGRSTAPHLHYQLERAGRVVDPLAYHGTLRRSLPAAERPRFRDAVQPLATLLNAVVSVKSP